MGTHFPHVFEQMAGFQRDASRAANAIWFRGPWSIMFGKRGSIQIRCGGCDENVFAWSLEVKTYLFLCLLVSGALNWFQSGYGQGVGRV